MTIFTREFWDEAAPDHEGTAHRVAGLVGYMRDPVREPDALVVGCLRWLAEAHEPWVPPPIPWYNDLAPWERGPLQTPWKISVRGLHYKARDEYLTLEGWPIDTECWFLLVDCGHRVLACGATPELATFRGVISVAALRAWRDEHPKVRRQIEDHLRSVGK